MEVIPHRLLVFLLSFFFIQKFARDSLQKERRKFWGVCPHHTARPLEKRNSFSLWRHGRPPPHGEGHAVAGNAITSACFIATGANVTR